MVPEEAYHKYHKLISNLASKMARKHLPSHTDDLFQEGCIGLLRALETYDKTKGALSTHVYNKAFGKMTRYIEYNCTMVRKGRGSMNDLYWKGLIPADCYLNNPVSAEIGSKSHLDCLVDSSPTILSRLISFQTSNKVRQALFSLSLTEREITILKERLLVPNEYRTRLNIIGKRFGISSEAVRISENKLLKRLKVKLYEFKDYVSAGND